MGFTRRTPASRLERTDARADAAFTRGGFGRGQRLAARAERQRQELQQRTGRRWENYGRPVQD